MKKLFATILAAIAALTLVSCGSNASAPKGMKLASNEISDYYFYVPQNWTVDMSTGVASAYYSDDDRTNISFTSYAVNEPTTPEKYWESVKADYSAVFSELSEPEVKTTALDGVEAKQYVYTAKAGNLEFKIMQIFCVKNNTVYVFTYTATPEKYEEHIDKIALVIAEFRFM